MKKNKIASPFLTKLGESKAFVSIASSILSILIGLILGLIILIFLDASHAFSGFFNMLTSGLSSISKISKVLYTAAPLVMTGLAVAFAFKTGLFNIGAAGQYLLGMFAALYCAIVLKLPWPVCILAAGLAGALWGSFPGIFKALLNVNEVITSIMFNWIGVFVVNLLVANTPALLASTYGGADSSRTATIGYINPGALLPNLGLDHISNYLNIGILLAILFGVIIYIILHKTTFGYELMACGHNRSASKYAGINEKKNIILAMVISGALAGIGGAIAILSGTTTYQISKVLPANGFNGISVALLASSHPLGAIASALFISYIQVGGDAMQPEFAKENIDVIIAVIIYLSAFSLLMKGVIAKFFAKKEKEEQRAPIQAEIETKEEK